MTLTQDQINFYHRNGYLPYGRVLDDALLEEARREYDRLFEEAWQSNHFRNLSVQDGGGSEEKRQTDHKVYQIMPLSERSLFFRRLLHHAPILDVLEEIIGPNLMLMDDQALFKPPLTGGPVPWHQDNAYWGIRPASVVSCWLTLDPAFKENGAMQFIPGSQHDLFDHKTNDARTLLEARVDESQAVTVDLQPGECLFHHCQTLHHTDPNTSNVPRRAVAMHFMPIGCKGGDGSPVTVSFHHPVVRMRM